MTPRLFDDLYAVTMTLLPPQMDGREGRNMVYAIGRQESRLVHRRQIGGPARGLFQFERGGGTRGVLNHSGTATPIRHVLTALNYTDDLDECFAALEHNDILAIAFARLLLWTVPGPLPKQGEHQRAWEYYVEGWRPGKPHRQTWDAFYDEAWG